MICAYEYHNIISYICDTSYIFFNIFIKTKILYNILMNNYTSIDDYNFEITIIQITRLTLEKCLFKI